MKIKEKGLHMEIKEERIDDLEINGLKIIQNENWFCFGVDSVLLSSFAEDMHCGSSILDLGAGNGILELLISAKVENSQIVGIEVQEEVAQMARRSVELNNLENRIEIKTANIKDIGKIKEFDAVVTNPPYKEAGTGRQNEVAKKLIARHEILATLEDFIKTASNNLKDKGSMYMVNRPERLVDIFEYSRKYKLEPKELRMVYSKQYSKPVLVLVKATKHANRYLKVREPLYIYDENGNYSKEVLKIYGKDKENF